MYRTLNKGYILSEHHFKSFIIDKSVYYRSFMNGHKLGSSLGNTYDELSNLHKILVDRFNKELNNG